MSRNLEKRLLIGTLVSLSVLFLILYQVNVDELGKAFFRANLWLMVPFLASVAIFFWLKGERWRLLLHPLRPCALKEVMPSTMIGVAINYILFAYLGELVRTYLMHKETNLPKSPIFASIFLERTLDAIFVLLLAGIGIASTSPLPEGIVSAGHTITLIAVLAAISLACLVFFTEACINVLKALMGIFPLHVKQSLIRHVEQGIRGLHSLAHPRLLFFILLLSFLQWCLMAFCIFLSMTAAGIAAPFYASFITMAALAFGILLPSSPAQLGIVELCFILSLKIYGVEQEQALAAAILYHFFLYSAGILSGVWYMKRVGYTLAKVSRQAEGLRKEEER